MSVGLDITESKLKGIVYMSVAMLGYALVSVFYKYGMERYPLLQLMFFRSFFAIIPCSIMLMQVGGFSAMRTQRLPLIALNSVIGAMTTACAFGALWLLPLATAETIHYSETLFLTVFSAWILKESVGIHRWLAVLVGFVGIMITAGFTGMVFELGDILAIAFAIGDALFMINARILTRTEHSASIIMYYMLFLSAVTGIVAPFIWVSMPWLDVLAFIVMGLMGGISQLGITQAFRFAPASVVAPIIYTAVLWGIFFGFIFWGEQPTAGTIIGCILIIGSGLYIVYRETKKPDTTLAITPPLALPDEEDMVITKEDLKKKT